MAGIAEDARRLQLDESRLEPRTRTMVRRGRRHGPSSGAAWEAKVADFFTSYDVLVTPVAASGPPRAGAFDGKSYLATYLAAARSVPFTQAWNLAGNPALVGPLGEAGGRPLAVQLIGPHGSDELLLALGATLS